MSKTTSFLHDGSIGDIWSSLGSVKEFHKKTGKKAVYYLTNGQAAIYYEGAVHPTRNEDGVQVMLNKQMIEMIIPLLKVQPYISDAAIHNEEKIDIDFNMIRKTFVNMPNGILSTWYVIVYPDLAFNLAEPYITIPESQKDFAIGKTIIARTERYQNKSINYSFLKQYENDLIFAGTKKEYNLFCMEFDLSFPRLEVVDFLELAQALAQAKGLVANQTMIMQIAEGLKVPRVVELCAYAPNVTPVGENAFYFYAQDALELYFNTINGTLGEYTKTYIDKKKQENPAVVAG